ncbi:uncharacterized protein LOC129298454 isoform X3 [Prosopis cineraria]|uniref:uncharacterized protein LOC129298454 isoform X3 n=1 Tax=Prosopis cineraria TaxID=364024 RepID=UPI00240EBE66|nr:uncharacterized protein LOC129298454 isoform X3 [Prosopis cineraria]
MSPSLSASTLNSPPPSNSAPSPPSSVSWNSCLVQKLNGMLDLPFRSAFSGPPWSLSGLIGFLLAAPLGGLKALIFFCFGLGETGEVCHDEVIYQCICFTYGLCKA